MGKTLKDEAIRDKIINEAILDSGTSVKEKLAAIIKESKREIIDSLEEDVHDAILVLRDDVTDVISDAVFGSGYDEIVNAIKSEIKSAISEIKDEIIAGIRSEFASRGDEVCKNLLTMFADAKKGDADE